MQRCSGRIFARLGSKGKKARVVLVVVVCRLIYAKLRKKSWGNTEPGKRSGNKVARGEGVIEVWLVSYLKIVMSWKGKEICPGSD
jgi:hypothetical protein